MSAFAKLKDRAGQMEKLAKKIETEKSGSVDERFWKLTVDKKQTGSAVIRFLPAVDGEEFPYVRTYSHAFELPHRGSGQWFVEECPTTINREDCPICAMNNEEWAKGTKEAQDLARYRKRNLSYIANIYVVDDPAKPENNGKQFLFQFGARIFQKIEGALKPEFPDIPQLNPFDFWEGANFKLRARELDGQRSYDMSVFDTPGPLLDSDEAMEEVWKRQYPLLPEIVESKFKSNAEIISKYNKLMGVKAPTTNSFSGGSQASAPATAKPPAPAPAKPPAPAPAEPPVAAPQAAQPPKTIDPADDPSAGDEGLPWEESKAAATPPAPTPAPAAPSGGSLADKYRAMVKGKK